jgi:DNA-binding NtrC family response regulator
MSSTAGTQMQDGRDASRILIVGASALKRAHVQRELEGALASGTRFAQADNVWEALQQAPQSSMVMLADDLPGICAHTLMGLLGRRQPWLPVLALDAPEAQTPPDSTPAVAGI